MPFPLLAILVTLVGAALAGLALHLWPAIMGWARTSLLPWIDRNLPELSEAMTLAFEQLDGIAVEARRAVRSAWRRVRTVLLAETAEFVRLVDNEWAVRITSYLNSLKAGEKPVVRLVTEQRLDYDDLPDHVRRQALANGATSQTLDIVEVRDQLLAEDH